MRLFLKYWPVFAVIALLFTKDVALVICTTDNPLYWMENVEEQEKSDNKEKEDKKESDDKKLSIVTYSLVSNHLSITARHVVSDRKYCAPSFEIASPPPEQLS